MKNQNILLILIFSFGLPVHIASADGFKNSDIQIRLKPRTPNQMAAFYEARGFPKRMIQELNQVCFITIGIKNKTDSVLWHDLAHWQFSTNGKVIQRFDSEHWKQRWQQLNIPMSSQSTFRWTLMPEQLDFRPQEHEGGNITLPRGPHHYTIYATFQTGPNKTGRIIKASMKNIRCPDDIQGSVQ